MFYNIFNLKNNKKQTKSKKIFKNEVNQFSKKYYY